MTTTVEEDDTDARDARNDDDDAKYDWPPVNLPRLISHLYNGGAKTHTLSCANVARMDESARAGRRVVSRKHYRPICALTGVVYTPNFASLDANDFV